jgi:hypothetical protein
MGILLVLETLMILVLIFNPGANISLNDLDKSLVTKSYVANDITPLEKEAFAKDENIQNNNDSNILWSGLGASLGGALAGAVAGGYFQSRYSKQDHKEKEHFSDIKKEVIDPLIGSLLNDDSSSFLHIHLPGLFLYYEKGSNVFIEIRNVLFRDLLDNHYHGIYPSLKSLLNKYNDIKRDQGSLISSIKDSLLDELSKIPLRENERFNQKAISELTNTIFENTFDHSQIRKTNYDKDYYVYFSNTEDYTIPFGLESEKYTIFQVGGDTKENNFKRTEELIIDIRNKISRIKEVKSLELENFRNNVESFYNTRDELLTTLLTIRYSTKLEFVNKSVLGKSCNFFH